MSNFGNDAGRINAADLPNPAPVSTINPLATPSGHPALQHPAASSHPALANPPFDVATIRDLTGAAGVR